MNNSYSIWKSRTFWTIVFTFAYNGYAAISGQLPTDVTVVINAIAGMLATYFHVAGVQNAALASAGKSPQSGQ
jgi:hypothetical protein